MTPRLLLAYLEALRREGPVTADTVRQLGLWPGVERCPLLQTPNPYAGFVKFLEECRNDLPHSRHRVIIDHWLFADETPRDRERAVAAELNVTENYYKNHKPQAVEALLTIMHPRLMDKLRDQESDTGGVVQPSYTMLEIDRRLELHPIDRRHQTWTTWTKYRCETVAQPIVHIFQGWSGTGRKKGDIGRVEVLSGQERDEDFRHAFLRSRREDEGPYSWTLYLFDLGEQLRPGETDTLVWRQQLYDRDETFKTFISWNSARHPAIERIGFKVIPNGHPIAESTGFREEPAPTTGRGFKPVPPFESLSETDGEISYEVYDIDHRSRYCVDWRY